jgi:hypothetical protein
MKVRNSPLMQVCVYIYALAHFDCEFFEIPVSSLYEPTENELQGSGMAISKKIDQGPQSHRFRNNRLPSAFNVEVEGAVVEVVKHFNSRNSRSKARVFFFFCL